MSQVLDDLVNQLKVVGEGIKSGAITLEANFLPTLAHEYDLLKTIVVNTTVNVPEGTESRNDDPSTHPDVDNSTKQ